MMVECSSSSSSIALYTQSFSHLQDVERAGLTWSKKPKPNTCTNTPLAGAVFYGREDSSFNFSIQLPRDRAIVSALHYRILFCIEISA